jgi:hypothetical protein
VLKLDHPDAPGRVDKQRRRLAELAETGLPVARCLAYGDDWAEYEYAGESLRSSMPIAARRQLIAFIEKCVKLGIRPGDCHRSNLCWDGTSLRIVDSGRLKRGSAADIEEYLTRRLL